MSTDWKVEIKNVFNCIDLSFKNSWCAILSVPALVNAAKREPRWYWDASDSVISVQSTWALIQLASCCCLRKLRFTSRLKVYWWVVTITLSIENIYVTKKGVFELRLRTFVVGISSRTCKYSTKKGSAPVVVFAISGIWLGRSRVSMARPRASRKNSPPALLIFFCSLLLLWRNFYCTCSSSNVLILDFTIIRVSLIYLHSVHL